MSSSEQDLQQSTNEQLTDIGARLRQAREDKKLTKEVVATQLKLRVLTITHLEANNFSELPGETFIRGYIRSYANLLEIDGNELARQYEPEPQNKQRVNYSPIRNIERANRTRFIFVLLAVLVLVVAGLGYYWWQEQEGNQVQQTQQLVSSTDEIRVDGVDGVQHIQSLDELNATTAEMELEEVQLPEEPEQLEVAESTNEKKTKEDAQAIDEDVLELSFIEDCWIRITDTEGNELASGLKRAGDSLVLNAKAPFEIHLGYAPGVFISLNGKQIDFDSSIRGNVARIKLG